MDFFCAAHVYNVVVALSLANVHLNMYQSDFILTVFLNLLSSGDYCKVNLCHNGATCVTGVGDDPFICICADGFGGDTCNLTETGTAKKKKKHS